VWALARGIITVLGILRAEALHHIKAVLWKLGIMGCGLRPRWVIRGKKNSTGLNHNFVIQD
jgi:hypothetical protein